MRFIHYLLQETNEINGDGWDFSYRSIRVPRPSVAHFIFPFTGAFFHLLQGSFLGFYEAWDWINSIIIIFKFYIAPTLYDTHQRITLKLLSRSCMVNPSAARHISAISLGYGCAPW